MKLKTLEWTLPTANGPTEFKELGFLSSNAIIQIEVKDLTGSTPSFTLEMRSGPVPFDGVPSAGDYSSYGENHGNLKTGITADVLDTIVVPSPSSLPVGPFIALNVASLTGTITGGTVRVTIAGV